MALDKEKVERGEVQLRSITLGDFVKAKDEVSPSVHEDAFSIAEVISLSLNTLLPSDLLFCYNVLKTLVIIS